MPEDVRLSSARARDGRRVWFVHHWWWGTAKATVPVDVLDVTDPDRRFEAGTVLALGPWNVRVINVKGHVLLREPLTLSSARVTMGRW